jgi:hypothetical protein
MTIYHLVVHGCVKSLFLVLFDEWLTPAIPFPTTFLLNLGWKMRHIVPTLMEPTITHSSNMFVYATWIMNRVNNYMCAYQQVKSIDLHY